MKKVNITNGKFEATLQMLEDGRVSISFIIPEQTETFNPEDYSYIIEHMAELIKDTSGKYSVQFQGVDAPIPP